MIKFRQKQYTQWDSTDALKQMKDSDILAEKKRENPSRIGNALKGGGVGAIAGGVLGGLAGIRKGNVMGGFKKGAIIGGSIGAVGNGIFGGAKERRENNFYNDRLEYAKSQALRREKKDWKQNMTQREGYTY